MWQADLSDTETLVEIEAMMAEGIICGTWMSIPSLTFARKRGMKNDNKKTETKIPPIKLRRNQCTTINSIT